VFFYYTGTYRETLNVYLKVSNQINLVTDPYKTTRDTYVTSTSTYTKSLYE
jgi:hypothetical protein